MKQLEPIVAQARSEVEAPEQAAPTEPLEATTEPDEMTTAELEIKRRIAGLTDARQGLALDALTDDRKADELADLDAVLAGAEIELEHMGLARVEANRRVRQAAVDAEQKARQKARDTALALSGDREKLEAKLGLAALALAEALAAVDSISAQQARALSAAGSPQAWQQVTPSPMALRRVLEVALRQAGAPTGWLD